MDSKGEHSCNSIRPEILGKSENQTLNHMFASNYNFHLNRILNNSLFVSMIEYWNCLSVVKSLQLHVNMFSLHFIDVTKIHFVGGIC